MRDLITVAKFTGLEMVKRKSFLISNLIILLLIVIAFNIPNVMNALKGEESENADKTEIMVVDLENVFGEAIITSLNEIEDSPYHFVVKSEEIDREQINQKIENKELDGVIFIKSNGENVEIEYVVESLGMYGYSEGIGAMFSETYRGIKLANSGLTTDEIIKINEPVNMTVTELKEGSSGGTLFFAMMLCIVLFYAIYFCAYQVSSSITIEKTSKIMETLVTSTKPRTIVLGKTIGIGLVGLLQVMVIVFVAFLSYRLFLPEGFLDGLIDLSGITPSFVIVTILYFILGYTLYSLLYALTGATISKPEDVNSANAPINMLAVAGFFLAYFPMMNPTGSVNTFARLFPISAPFSTPIQLVTNTATMGDVILSMAILIVTIIIIASIAIKIYSNAVLHYGNKLSVKDMLKIYKSKD